METVETVCAFSFCAVGDDFYEPASRLFTVHYFGIKVSVTVRRCTSAEQ